MNKSELIDRIAARANLTKSDAAKALEAVICTITDALVDRDAVTLVGFGTWDTSDRPARQVRNPKTGAMIQLAETTVPRFRSGKALKTAVACKKACAA